MSAPVSPPALHLVRLPGEHGPIVRCTGELSVATVEALRRELALLEPLAHPVLTLNLAGCSSLDVEGILTILEVLQRLQEEGRRLAVVAGTGSIAQLLGEMEVDEILPVYPTEPVAALALRGGGSPPTAPGNWELARAKTVARWCTIQAALEKAPLEEILRHLTSMTGLCQRAEEIHRDHPAYAHEARCQFCPLSHELGGQPEDTGCHRVLDPLIEMVHAGRLEAAREGIAAMISFLEAMPLPEEPPRPRRGMRL
jgi:anti-anti-sigma regulatory factor